MVELLLARPGLLNPGEKHWSDLLNISIAYLAGAARASGIGVKVIDGKNEGHTSIDETVAAISAYNPDVVGLSAMTTEYPMAAQIALKLKQYPNAPVTILGGAHANVLPAESLAESSGLDYVMVGEAEYALVNLIEMLKRGEDPENIPGLYKRDKSGTPFLAVPATQSLDAASLPYPAWDLFTPADAYPVLTGRGCPYNCVFCGKNLGHQVRIRPVDNVVAEIEWLQKTFRPKMITFADETFGMYAEYTEALLSHLIEFHTRTGTNFAAQTRFNHISAKSVQMMKLAGFEYLSLGVESGDPNVLSQSGKGLSLEQVETGLKLIKDAGIPHRLYFILGLPGETNKSLRNTINFSTKLNPDRISVALLVPYPGTKVYNWAVNGKKGYRLLSKNWEQFDKYLDKSLELENLLYKRLRLAQIQIYLETYLRNYRFQDLAQFLFMYRSFFLNYGKKLITGILLQKKTPAAN